MTDKIDTTQPKVIERAEDLPEWVLLEEIAQFFRITIQVARKWRKQNRFPGATMMGGSRNWRIPRQDVINLSEEMYGRTERGTLNG